MSRVDRLAAELAINQRLRWAVHVCEKLGIDDPVCWMNNTDPRVLDLWIAYYLKVKPNG